LHQRLHRRLPLKTVHTIADVRTQVRAWQQTGDTVAFVPTMGNLHDGHITLVREGSQGRGARGLQHLCEPDAVRPE
jgi:hypothetical protein